MSGNQEDSSIPSTRLTNEKEKTAEATAAGWVAVLGFALVAHGGIRLLGQDARPLVFLVFAAVYLAWPLLCFMVPRSILVPVMLFPFFGIWLGLYYTGDIGQNYYFFEAQPPCFSGIWSLLVGGAITSWRLRKKH